MKKTAVLAVMLSSLTSFGFCQAAHHRSATSKPLTLSNWIRHAGLHYIDLIDELDQTRDIKDEDERRHAQEQYAKFLDDAEADLAIDAHGNDLVFLDGILKKIRELENAVILDSPHQIDRQVRFEARIDRVISCQSDAKESIRTGILEKAELDGCAAPFVVPPSGSPL